MGATTRENDISETRVLILMPTGRDALLVCSALENAHITAQVCPNPEELQETIAEGAGAVLIAQEALVNGTLDHLIKSFNSQPIWSDLPVVLFAANGQSAERLLETVGTQINVTIVERPIRITILISAVRGALRARQRQYQARDLLNQLKESDRQKDLFLATLSHELRTPLNSIIGWIQLLRGNSNMDINYGLNVIERNAKAQAEMISDILFISRVITGKFTLNLQTVDVLSVIQSAIDVVRPALDAKKIQLQTFFDSGIGQIKGDSDRLQQIFWNLLSNAIKFTPHQGQIIIRVKNRISSIEVEIKDSGQGIKPEFLPFVFERFRQADNSYTREVGGLGLGLAIVRHLVELHGGTVSVKSEGINRGAAFTVTLPASDSQVEETSTQADNQSIAASLTEKILNKINLLLVEDDADSREMLKVVFEQHGVKVKAVDSAAKALESIKEFPPDILVSDIGLPGVDGYELIDKIRKLSPDRGGLIPAIALTGYVSLQDRHQAFNLGYQEHLAKPVDINQLLELVKQLLSHKTV